MRLTLTRSAVLQRAAALLLSFGLVPAVLALPLAVRDQPVREGIPSPRTVVAPDAIRVTDPEATERARRAAAEAVEPVFVDDNEAKAAIVEHVRDAFTRAAEVRAGDTDGVAPTRGEQVAALEDELAELSPEGVRALVDLSDAQLAQVTTEAVEVAQQLARLPIRDDAVERIANVQLEAELAVRPVPPTAADLIVKPIIRAALRPTVIVDEGATQDARAEASAKVDEVERVYPRGSVIVAAGEVVDPVQYAALRQRGLEGVDPWLHIAAALGVVLLTVGATALYLRGHHRRIWRSDRRLVLLALLFLLLASVIQIVALVTPAGSPGWLFLMPVGAVAMLTAVLFDATLGLLVALPATVLVSFVVPGRPVLAVFAALAALISVPLVSGRSARGDLRRAAITCTAAYASLAAALSAVFGQPELVGLALLAGLANGVLTAVIVNGSLPFLESFFGILTATSLLDLADRNHPLLRELEQKALGSYNHSIMVSTMCERAARAINADSLLVSVAALYHDIGKVRRPYFFVENQFGTGNPHDDLAPEISAVIIQDHVTDGIEMSRVYKLPPEITEGIATHHGTTLVSFFYRQALASAQRGADVDEEHFRYKGRKPSSREMAILMLADCCEGASRAAAMHNRNLTRVDLESIVTQLISERVEDGQLDESALTFRDLRAVQESFIETLVGVYHPRIAYPDPKVPDAGVAEVAGASPPAP